MADEMSLGWDSEDISDDNFLFMRVHRQLLGDSGTSVNPGAFRNRPTEKDGMSTDWQKYSTAVETRNRARTPRDNAVIQLQVGAVRRLNGQTVVHTPDIARLNRAHTDVIGEKNPEIRLKFCRLHTVVIPLER